MKGNDPLNDFIRVGEDDPVILSAENITKIFPGTIALSDVSFKVYRGRLSLPLIGKI
jgi:ABC-type sugar transport system ATPase subunit